MASTIGAATPNVVIHMVLRGCQGTELFHPTRSLAQRTKADMYTTQSVSAARKANRVVALASARRYATHPVAPSDRTTLGSGEACSMRPDTASTALSRSPYAITRRKTWPVGITPSAILVFERLCQRGRADSCQPATPDEYAGARRRWRGEVRT